VYFSVRSFDGYGKLSNRRLEDLLPADQGEPDSEQARKRDPLDFALWKAQKPGEDTAWDSPWGPGRPGWHIECSAMAEEILGLEFDIHGGGSDLMFPHHENEIAQTEAGRERPLARIWMHNGMIRFGEEKMAKSVGNVAALADALDSYGRDALIVYMLGGHYRQPLAFSAERMEEARRSARRLADFARLVGRSEDLTGGDAEPDVRALQEEFFAALRDDFNTPEALAALFKLVSEGNRRLGDAGRPLPGAGPVLRKMLGVLGLESMLEGHEDVDEDALRLVQEREDARLSRDFARADAVRGELLERGWEVRDTPEGPVLVPVAGS
jgi:cysteinyl-tRNA synthetase